jgi:hypothetical protein
MRVTIPGDRSVPATCLAVAPASGKPGRRAVLGGLAALGATAARAQPAAPHVPGEIARPPAVVVLSERALAEADFLPALLARLREALLPPVESVAFDIDYTGMPREGGQLLGDPLLRNLVNGISWTALAGRVPVVLLREPMRNPPARFNFALSAAARDGSWRIVAISLAMLGQAKSPEVVAARVARMAVKNVARVCGYAGSDRCVFGFPRSLAELDAMPEGFCEPDLSVLAAAGLARRA